MRVAVLVVLLGGCIHDQLVTCGDLSCPAGNVCTAGGCASPAAVEACATSVETAECMVDGFSGHCIAGACQIAKCGDGRMQFGEACDDDNTDAGDGCSAHCDSIEVCGNAVVDSFVGEQCDAGIRGLSADGCTSACTAEILLWSDVSPRSLVGRASYTMATDTVRNRVVMFGGMTPAHATDATTLEWNGHSWDVRTPLHSPPPRVFAMMAYDEARHRTVLFGGMAETTNDARNDTWEWDGIDWHEMSPPMKPMGRADAVMAYDPNTQRVIMFGGRTQGPTAPLDETWSWDGTRWMRLSPNTTPPARTKASFARAPNNKLMLVGGLSGSTTLPDRWIWNGMNWLANPGTMPPARSDAAIAYDPIRDRTVLWGGAFATDLWEWNGTAWSSVPASSPPPGGIGYRMAWDPVTRRSLVFGGDNGTIINVDTWQIDVPTAAWTKVALVEPQPRTDGAIAYDAARGNVVMLGGFGGSLWGETWIWSGQRWLIAADAAASPPPRQGHAMAFDEARAEIVMFGGDNSTDTWTWNGATWTQQTTAIHPTARHFPMMTYDANRQRIVLFGGSDPTMRNDVWEWDGAAWTDVTPATGPPARRNGVFVYDRARQVTVLYGGVDTDFFDDTWTWNGTAWNQMTPAESPKRRDGAAAVYDARMNTIIMFGGAQISDETWQWDGTAWSRLPIPVSPPMRANTMGAYDALHGRVILFGGYDSGLDVELDDTWSFGYQSSVSPPERCDLDLDTDSDQLVGCADPDCWARCDPQCPPGTTGCATERPRCGDGVCSTIEDGALCPADCPAP